MAQMPEFTLPIMEYCTIHCEIKEFEKTLNALAEEGWSVVSSQFENFNSGFVPLCHAVLTRIKVSIQQKDTTKQFRFGVAVQAFNGDPPHAMFEYQSDAEWFAGRHRPGAKVIDYETNESW